MKTSPQLMFWNDPAMKAFHDKFMGKFSEKFTAPLEKDLGIKVDDFLALPQGQFTLGVTVNGSNGMENVDAGAPMSTAGPSTVSAARVSMASRQAFWKAGFSTRSSGG